MALLQTSFDLVDNALVHLAPTIQQLGYLRNASAVQNAEAVTQMGADIQALEARVDANHIAAQRMAHDNAATAQAASDAQIARIDALITSVDGECYVSLYPSLLLTCAVMF